MTTTAPLGHRLRRPIAFACGISLPAIGLALAAVLARSQALAQLDEAKERTQRTEIRLQRFEDEEKEIRKQVATLQDLQAKGIVGDSRDGAWDEILQDLRQELKLPALGYGSPPNTVTAAHGEFAIHTTRLHLQLELLHEGQFVDFLQRLESKAGALILLQSCRLERLNREESDAATANLRAACELDWVGAQIKRSGQP